MGNMSELEVSTGERIAYLMGLMFEDAENEINKIDDTAFLEALRLYCFEKDNMELQKVVEKKIGKLGA